MSGIILYGAGTRGIRVEDFLYLRGIQIKGFMDSFRGGRFTVKLIENII